MAESLSNTLSEICGQMEGQKLPRWRELPDIELYMDQVLALIGRYLGDYPGFDEKGLTASMVNNYVKMGAILPPRRKRYTRVHLAYLLVICVLKASLPIAAIQRLISDALAHTTEEALYDWFCDMFEGTTSAVAELHMQTATEPPAAAVFRAALRAQAEQALALKLYTRSYTE